MVAIGSVVSSASIQDAGASTRGEAHRAARTVYVALGASDVVGVGATHPASENWTALLARHLRPGSRYLNLGHSGILIQDALRAELPQAVAARPTIATVWLAVNDVNQRIDPASYARNLDRMVGRLRATGAKVYVGNVPDLRIIPAYKNVPPASLRHFIDLYNTVIAHVAAAHGATVVDLYAHSGVIWSHPDYISADGFHPSTRGYVALAGVFYATMHAAHAL